MRWKLMDVRHFQCNDTVMGYNYPLAPVQMHVTMPTEIMCKFSMK